MNDVANRQVINGLRLAAKLMTNAHMQLSEQDQQSRMDSFNLYRSQINDEIAQRNGTPYSVMEIVP